MQGEVLSGLEGIGENSTGITATTDAGTNKLRLNMAVVKRGPALEVVMLVLLDGSTPQVELRTLAETLDERVAEALK
jgi:hypothetical protein